MLFSKTEDAIDHLHFPQDTPAGVVMGNLHAYNAKILQSNPEERKKVIARFAESLLETTDAILEKYPGVPKDLTKQFILDYLSRGYIAEITDPQTPDFTFSLPTVIQQEGIVSLKYGFKSKQIEEAIVPLRQSLKPV